MPLKFPYTRTILGVVLAVASSVHASAASCKTQSQMTPEQRNALASTARGMAGQVQNGDIQGLRANTIPAVAADFDEIANSVNTLKPALLHAVFTVDSLYLLDASAEASGAARTDFYCGSPVVVLNFNGLPPGTYALAIVHATGVPQPQQITLILSESSDHRWMLGGFFSKPMTEAGHDGLWYWISARKFAQKNMNWDAWFYYRLAVDSLQPVDFISSPNLEVLQREQDRVKPANFPGSQQPLVLDSQGSVFKVTSIDTTTTFGALDLEVHYTPDASQAAQLRDPPAGRRQVTELMARLLALHPDLPAAFHGVWVQADGDSSTLFSLELPMDQITPGMTPAPPASGSVLR